MYASFGHPAAEPLGCADRGSTDGMDTSGGALDAYRWSPQEQDQAFFENGEYLPSAIDTTQHCYNVAVSSVGPNDGTPRAGRERRSRSDPCQGPC